MGLGAPIWLLLLATVAVPWLVHRMRQHDLRVVELPTVALLRRAVETSARRRAIDDLLLLATRMALLATVAFALTAPFVWATTLTTTGHPVSVVVVLDDSMSMQRRFGNGTLLAEAISRARHVIAGLPRGSEVAIVAAGRPARSLAALGTAAEAQNTLAALPQHSTRGTSLAAAIELASGHLAAAQHAERSIYVLTDLVGPGASPPPVAGGVPVRWDVIGAREASFNLAVLDVRVETDADSPGAYRLHARIGATATTARSVSVTARADDRIVATVPATISGAVTDVELRVDAASVPDSGSVTVALDVNDALDGDNQRACLLNARGGIRVLLVNGDPIPAHPADELHFLGRAMPLAAASDLPVAVHAVDAVSLMDTGLDGFDLIWLANVAAPDAQTVARITSAVAAGAALVISAGDNVDIAPYNAALAHLLPARLEGVSDHSGIGLDATGMDGLSSLSTLSAIRTTRRLMTRGGVNTTLQYTDGVPALMQHAVGQGSVALWTTSVDADWTDLPYRPAFIALVKQLLGTSSESTRSTDVINPGDTVPVRVGSDATSATVINPAGVRSPLPLDTSPVVVDGSLTLLPGAYRIEATNRGGEVRELHRGSFVVAPPIDESDLTPHPIPPDAEFESADTAAAQTATQRVQRSIDYWWFAAIAPWFALEAVLRRRKRSPRLTRSVQA